VEQSPPPGPADGGALTLRSVFPAPVFSSLSLMRWRFFGLFGPWPGFGWAAVISLACALCGATSVSSVPKSSASAAEAPGSAAEAPGSAAEAPGSAAEAPGKAPQEKCWAVARLKYGGGGDWYAGPSMLVNLSKRLRSDLGLNACSEERQVAVMDGNLYEYPILFMTGHGNVAFSEEERKVLREYLLRGGLLFADDNYGMDTSFRREMKALFPNHPMAPLGLRHPVFSSHYRFPDGLPKVHEHDGKRATAYGIAVEGRTVVFYSYECDLGNGWEDLGTYKDPPELHEAALRMGVNVVAWFLQGATVAAVP